MHIKDNEDIPSFLQRSTASVALIAVFILFPFSINNFYRHRYFLGALILLVTAAAFFSYLQCKHDQYSVNFNLYILIPLITFGISLAISEQGIIGSYWSYLGLAACYFILPRKQSFIASIFFTAIITAVSFLNLEWYLFIRYIAVFMGLNIFAYISIKEIYDTHFELKKIAITDTLTGLYNRTILNDLLSSYIDISKRNHTPISILMFDIDHFKQINDQYGHDVGDTVLAGLGKLLKNFFRNTDYVFRIGGEEFLVLLYNSDQAQSAAIAERLREKVANTSLLPNAKVTLSAAVVTFQKGMTINSMLKTCDQKLYQAKEKGRNTVVA